MHNCAEHEIVARKIIGSNLARPSLFKQMYAKGWVKVAVESHYILVGCSSAGNLTIEQKDWLSDLSLLRKLPLKLGYT